MMQAGRKLMLCGVVGYPRRWTWQCHRFLATRARRGPWSLLSPSEQAAWSALNYDADSWEGRKLPPTWKKWSELTAAEKSVAIHGLGLSDSKAWEAVKPIDDSESSGGEKAIQPLSSLTKDERTSALTVQKAGETRLSRQKAEGGLAKLALSAAKAIAPVLGPVLRSASHTRGRGGLAILGGILEQVPSALDAASGVLDVTGIDTVMYLDDSGSMVGRNLDDGYKALRSLEGRLKVEGRYDDRFLPTRIIKFGAHPQVLAPSDEDWNSLLVSAAWDGSSGGTYMWKMIENDIKSKYRPAGGKLRVVVITDGADNMSPGEYHGVRGFDPLMSSLLEAGFDIEWHIIVVGNYDGLVFGKELSDSDQKLYESLCRATGGHFVSVGASGWNEDDEDVSAFLEAVENSGYDDSKDDRIERQEQYRLEARKGGAEDFDWLPALPNKPKK